MDSVVPYIAAIVPTIIAAAFFYAIIKRIMEADRRERLAQSKFEAEERRRLDAENLGEGTPQGRENDPESGS